MTEARLELDEYTIRVLDVIKGKYGLKNRSEALSRLAKECGNSHVEQIANEDALIELDEIYNNHKKKHQDRKMTSEELKNLLDI